MVHLAPGDPIAAVMPAESSQAEIEATKRAYGFDKPLPVQYLVWLRRVAQGDLRRSIATRRAVVLDVRDALANSLLLAPSSSLLACAPRGWRRGGCSRTWSRTPPRRSSPCSGCSSASSSAAPCSWRRCFRGRAPATS